MRFKGQPASIKCLSLAQHCAQWIGYKSLALVKPCSPWPAKSISYPDQILLSLSREVFSAGNPGTVENPVSPEAALPGIGNSSC